MLYHFIQYTLVNILSVSNKRLAAVSIHDSFQVSVFMPCQRNNCDVECRDDQEPQRVRNGESKELIRNKEDEHNDRDRITPKLFSEKTND